MAREILNNLDTYGIQRGKINNNFLEVWTIKLEEGDVLTRGNNSPYTPTAPYNPATKQYVDSFGSNWSLVYDPTGISADAFDRGNHHGSMAAEYVAQDSEHRFVSDAERAAWDNKEDPIGDKGTAFNKDFGTTAGTVAEGNHVHNNYEAKDDRIVLHIENTDGNPHGTRAAQVLDDSLNSVQDHIDESDNPHGVTAGQVGLDNVDNTSDLDKPISTAVQTALDNKMDIPVQPYRAIYNTVTAGDLGTRPTEIELDAIIPDPETNHGYFIKDSSDHFFFAIHDGTGWYYEKLTKAI